MGEESTGVAYAKAQKAKTQDGGDSASTREVQDELNPGVSLDAKGSDSTTGGGLAGKGGPDAYRMHEDHDFEGMTQPDFIATNSEEIAKGGKAEIRNSAGDRV